MGDLVWCTKIGPTRHICVSTLSSVTIQESGATDLGDDAGYFIYEVEDGGRAGGIQVLGKAASEEAAMRLVDIFLASTKRSPAAAHA
jgi:hypothetical protein